MTQSEGRKKRHHSHLGAQPARFGTGLQGLGRKSNNCKAVAISHARFISPHLVVRRMLHNLLERPQAPRYGFLSGKVRSHHKNGIPQYHRTALRNQSFAFTVTDGPSFFTHQGVSRLKIIYREYEAAYCGCSHSPCSSYSTEVYVGVRLKST